eukprot:1042371-Prorocentrum_minimum.AAC.1
MSEQVRLRIVQHRLRGLSSLSRSLSRFISLSRSLSRFIKVCQFIKEFIEVYRGLSRCLSRFILVGGRSRLRRQRTARPEGNASRQPCRLSCYQGVYQGLSMFIEVYQRVYQCLSRFIPVGGRSRLRRRRSARPAGNASRPSRPPRLAPIQWPPETRPCAPRDAYVTLCHSQPQPRDAY